MGMSFCVLGMSHEFKNKIGFNSIWPRTGIASSAIEFYLGSKETLKTTRSPRIMSDAIVHILKTDNTKCTGNFFIDDEVLVNMGETDLNKYKMDSSVKDEDLMIDFFIDTD